MGKGRDEAGGAKEHRPGLRRFLWNHDHPRGDAWALAPSTQGGEDTVRESKPAPKKGKTNYPHPTSTLCLPPPRPTGTLPRGREKPQALTSHTPGSAPAQHEAGGGRAGALTTSQAPLPAGDSPTLKGARIPSPASGVPATRSLGPQSHTSRERGKRWPSREDSRKKQRF